MKKTSILMYLTISLVLTGCMTNLTSNLAPGATLDELGNTFVVRFDPDKRHLNSIIADTLTLMGHPAVAGEKSEIPEDVDTLVTYVDNWQWDITNYMIKINIQFRDGKSRELIVSGESYRTSLARKSPEEMIKETLIEVFKNKKS
ncbi:MAG: hypothetical protein K0A94_08010 [Desulfuromonadales bacterium]|nr:hypothetical protein [Desulfuromonadales bacterium]